MYLKTQTFESLLLKCAIFLFTVAGQEDNLYAKKNYDKYLSALKNSGLVSVEEKAQGASADVSVGAEGGAGAMVLLGNESCFEIILYQPAGSLISYLWCFLFVVNTQ